MLCYIHDWDHLVLFTDCVFSNYLRDTPKPPVGMWSDAVAMFFLYLTIRPIWGICLRYGKEKNTSDTYEELFKS